MLGQTLPCLSTISNMPNTAYMIYITSISIISLIILIALLKREIREREKLEPSNVILPPSLRYLSVVSLYIAIIMIVFVLLSVIGAYSDLTMCIITFQTTTALFYYFKVNISLFQLARLYFCFSKKNQYHTYGYPNWLFISIGLVLFCTWIGSAILIFVVQEYMPYDITGCESFINRTWTGYALLIIVMVYIIMDIVIVSLYFVKFCQFKKIYSKLNLKSIDNIENRMYAILQKILLLAVLIQIVIYFWIIIAQIEPYINRYVWYFLNRFMFYSVVLIGCLGNLLMLEHNEELFKKIMLKTLCWIKCLFPHLFSYLFRENLEEKSNIIKMSNDQSNNVKKITNRVSVTETMESAALPSRLRSHISQRFESHSDHDQPVIDL